MVIVTMRRGNAFVLVLTLAVVGCGGGGSSSSDTTVTTSGAGPTVARDRCLVRLHGKGDEGATTVANGVTVVAPTGNADGWGGRQWLYFPDEEYDAARAVVEEAAGCTQVIVDGFSNGASFAAKLYCRGEALGGGSCG